MRRQLAALTLSTALAAGALAAAPPATAAPKADTSPSGTSLLTVVKVVNVTHSDVTTHLKASTVGPAVACRDVNRTAYAKNVLGQTLFWFRLYTSWCWDRQFLITWGTSHVSEDNVFFCWGYDGEAPGWAVGGVGYDYWTRYRAGKFSCGFGILTQHKTLGETIRMQGGGGAS